MKTRKNNYFALLLATKLLIASVLIFINAGCVVVGIHEKQGQPYQFDNSLKIKPGMTQEQVISLLGEPYIIGREQDDDIILKYEWREMEGQSFIFGLFVMGEKRIVSVNGGQSTVTLASDSKTVKKIEYDIFGNANYDRLRGGNDVTSR